MSSPHTPHPGEYHDLRVVGSFKIGRSPICNIILKNGHVSKVHCSLNISSKADHGLSVGPENQVVIFDHSSNGTWITSSSGETIKLKQGKPTLLKEGDVILLTRSTEANPEVISYKYCSSPFPRITKHKQDQALHQDRAGMLECQAETIRKGAQANARTLIHLKRQHEPYGQESSPKKVRFQMEIKESINNHNPFFVSRVKEEEQSTEGLDDCAGFTIANGSVAVKELNNTTLYIDRTTPLNNDDQDVTHTTTPSSHDPVTPSSRERLSELSNICRSDKKDDSLLEEEPTKCAAFEQTSDCNAAEEGDRYDKCVRCGKWIPHVTLSLHEAVCEGQSQEAKSQDHVSLSSFPLGDSSFGGETMPKLQRLEKCLMDEVQGDVSISDEAREPEMTGKINKGESDAKRIQDKTCEKTIIETDTTSPSAFCDLPDESTESDIISCESRCKTEEKTATKISDLSILLGSHTEDDGLTYPHQCEPTISREESKERCTFCSKVLPVSELIAHVSECSKVSAVPRTDSNDAENIREACPYCGIYFEILTLVEHVTRCSKVEELNNTTLYIDRTTPLNNDDQDVTHTITPSSHDPVTPSSRERLSELSSICRSDKKDDSLLEEEPTKCAAFEQTSDCNAAEEGDRYDKCVRCGKWIPHVTLSLHEAVCEGQSQEAKSQDHVSLSSFPLGDSSFGGETMPKLQRLEKCLMDEVQGDVSISDGTREPEITGKINKGESDAKRIQDKTCEKTIIETDTTSSSAFCDLPDESTESDIISCESRCKTEEKTATKISDSSILLGSHTEDDGLTYPHQCEPTISREESKERCTFCSKVLPVSELIAHASECSKVSAVPRTDSDDAENIREACPYCGIYFEILTLVEHVTRCSKVEEVPFKDSYSFSSPVTGAGDSGDDPSLGDIELCPKCRREFSLLELINHADECKEQPSTSSDVHVESSLENAKDLVSSMASDDDKGVKNGVHKDRKDVIGHEFCELESCDNVERDKSKPDGHVPSSDTTCGDNNDRITETDHDVDGGSASDDVNRDEDREDEEGEADDYKENDDDDNSRRGDTYDGDVTRGHSDYDDDSHSNRSSISDTNDEDSKSHEKNDKSDECEGTFSVDDYAEPYSEASVPSDEFELCPNCFQLFHLCRLVEHASSCVSEISAVIKAVETVIATEPKKSRLFNPSTDNTFVLSDCPCCGVKLPVDVMRDHYPRCEKRHSQRMSRKGSARIEKNDPVEGFPEHVIRIDNLSTRTLVKDKRSVRRVASSTKTSDDSSKSSNSKAPRLHEVDDRDDREARESEVSLKKTTSSLDSYHDCEEQCIYCLKMFPVSVLVEHVCSCADCYENYTDVNDLEQCCYCLRTFPLNDLINHAQNCDQKTISSSQEDSQSDVIANSQSHSGEVLERCMYCFQDFPVSKLIRHSQKCDGDMSGPRERFQGFLPSVHDLSAISSVAILNDTQRAALQYVITCSAQDSKSVSSKLLTRVQRLGYSENDLKRTLQWVRSASPIIIHINLDKVLKFLVKDTHYRNRFETGTSGGSTDKTARKSWEDRIFNNAYHSSPPSERVKYGVLNIVGDPRGVRSCVSYGDSFLQLKKVRLRTTFASQDTSGAGVKLSCCEHYENVLFSYTDREIKAIMDVATGKVPFHRSDCISHYKEVQIHGPVSLSENVECIVVNPRHERDLFIRKRLDRFVEQNKCNLIWMDPDDLTGATPFSFGATGHHHTAMPILDSPLSHIRTRIRRRGSSRSKRKRT